MKLYLLFFSTIILSSVTAQPVIEAFGDIPDEHWTYKDSADEAYIIFDKGHVEFVEHLDQYRIQMTRHTRLAVKKASTFDASVEITLYEQDRDRKEQLEKVEAVTYNKTSTGITKTQISKKDIYESRESEHFTTVRFALPAVQDGSIIEVRYTYSSPFLMDLPTWYFENPFPTRFSVYQVDMIPFFDYDYFARGFTKFSFYERKKASEKRQYGNVSQSYGLNVDRGVEFYNIVHTFALDNLDAFAKDRYISSANEYRKRIDFKLSRVNHPSGGRIKIHANWQEIAEELLDEPTFGKYLEQSSREASSLLSKIKLSDSREKQISEIIQFVKVNYLWNGETSVFASQSLKSLLNSKTGNSADLNLLLVGLLRESGIEAHPLIGGTRRSSALKRDYPFMGFARQVLVYTPIKPFEVIDATEAMLCPTCLPANSIMGEGFVVKEEAPEVWVKLQAQSLSQEHYHVVFQIGEELSTQASIKYHNYASYLQRKELKAANGEKKESYSELFGPVTSFTHSDLSEVEQPLKVELTSNTPLEIINKHLFIQPFNYLESKLPKFESDVRQYPVEFDYPPVYLAQSIIHLPPNAAVDEIPEPWSVQSKNISAEFSYIQSSEFITCQTSISVTSNFIHPSDFAEFNGILKKIDETLNAPVILKLVEN